MRINRLTKILTWIFILYTLHITLYTGAALCASRCLDSRRKPAPYEVSHGAPFQALSSTESALSGAIRIAGESLLHTGSTWSEAPFQALSSTESALSGAIRIAGESLLHRAAQFIARIDNWLCPSVYAASKGNPPVAHWRFDESGGPTAYDETTNNNDGTLSAGAGGTNTSVGQMWTRQGKMGGAGEFDGTDDYVDVGNNANLSTGSQITLEAWIYPREFKAYSGIIDKYHDGNYEYFLEIYNTSGELTFRIRMDDVWTTLDSVPGLTLNNWQHVVATWNGSVMKVFINGIEKGSRSASGTTITATDRHVRIGSGWSDVKFNGLIDDARIYNYARTADQILVDYNAGSAAHLGAGTDPNEGNPPVGYWTLDENTGTTAYDRSGSGSNGTLTNMESTDWVAGKYGSALQFDGGGSNEYVSLSKINSLEGASNYTISAWIKTSAAQNGGVVGQFDNGSHIIAIHIGSDGIASFITYEGGYSNVSSNTAVNSGQWRYIAIVKSGTTGRIYIDGVEKNSGTVMNVISTTEIRIGTRENGAYPFNGLIDDVKIYNYARTQAQIAYDYNRGAPVAQYKFDEGGGPISHNEYSSADTGAAPIGWWKMDEGTGTTTADATGNASTGTLATAPATPTWSTSSKIGPYTLDFDGTDDYVDMGDLAIFDLTGSLTVSGWFYLDALSVSEQNDIFTSGENYRLAVLESGGTYKLRGWIHDGTDYRVAIETTGTVGLTTWNHGVMTYDRSNIILYLNGKEVARTANTTAVRTAAGSAKIGRANGSAEYWDGKIDDVRIYNYARTAEQIYNDYKTTHGTLVADAKFSDGKIGKALELDGTGDYVLVPHSTSLNHDGNYTISAWFYLDNWINYNAVLAKSDYPSNGSTQYQMQMSDAVNTKAIYSYGGGNGGIGTRVDSSANFCETGKWIFATITQEYDGNNTTIKFYKNGVLYSSGTASGKTYNAVSDMTIGNTITDGKIDDIRVYNYVRTADQILQDYNAGAARLGAQSAGIADPWGGAMPVEYWKLDENTGIKAYDASGNGKDGILGGDGVGTDVPTWTQGVRGPCLKFDGSNDFVDTKLTRNDLGANYSIGAWFKYTGSTGRTYSAIIGGNETATEFFIGKNSGNTDIGWQDGNYISNMGTGTNAFDGNWHYLTISMAGTTGKLYLDGKLLNTQTFTGCNVAEGIYIGLETESGGYGWDGLIDDVCIYNYARTQAQIAWDYNQGKSVAHWRFDEATSGAVSTSAGAIKDESSNNNDGTASATTFSYTTGKFGGALSFDGNDYVSVTDGANSCFDFGTANFTLSVWVKTTMGATGDWVGILSKFTTNNFWIQLNPDNKYVGFGWDGTNYLTSSKSVNDGNWHHIVGVRTGETSGAIYVDGVKVLESSSLPNNNLTDNTEIRIGSLMAGTPRYFIGQIDDVRIYNYARTAEQVQQDYLNGAAARLGD